MLPAENAHTKIQSFVLFDTETTGLPSKGNNPRITELCLLALTRNELTMENSAPRVFNKLSLCCNPMKMISAASSKVTGLHNDSLEQLAPFKNQASLVCQFLANLPQPACLVAHNGNGFDFPLLVAHLKKSKQSIPEGVLCADSLEAFRSFDGLPPVPDFVQRKLNQSSETRARPDSNLVNGQVSGGNMCSAGNQKSCISAEAETQDPIEIESTPPPVRKRMLVIDQGDCDLGDSDKVTDPSSTNLDRGASWDVGGFATPAKRALVVQPTAPSKQENPIQIKASESRVRQNLFGKTLEVNGNSSTHQNAVKKQTQSGAGLLSVDENKSSANNVVKPCEEEALKLQTGIPVEHGNSVSEGDFVQCENSSANLPSLTDSEKFLLEAAEEAEKWCGADITDSEKEMVAAVMQAEIQENKTPNHTNSNKHSISNSDSCQSVCSEKPEVPLPNPSQSSAPRLSYSLPKIYTRVFGQEPVVSHTAEDDCLTLLKIIRATALHTFPRWCDLNAVHLDSVPAMF